MQYKDEAALKEALGIETWRELSKDKFVEFAAMIPQTDREVALAVIGRFPKFADLARAALEDTTRAHESVIGANDRSQAMVHEIHLARLAILRAELDKDLSPEERLRVLDGIRDVNDRACANDSENKRFLAACHDKTLVAVIVFGVLTVVFVGARVAVKAGGKSV